MQAMLRRYLEVVKYLLQTYLSQDVVAETNAALTCYTQPSTVMPVQYVKALVYKSLKYREVYEEYLLKGLLIKGLHESLHHSMQ